MFKTDRTVLAHFWEATTCVGSVFEVMFPKPLDRRKRGGQLQDGATADRVVGAWSLGGRLVMF